MAAALPASADFPKFDCSSMDGISVRWRKYLARYKNMMKGFNINEPGQLTALLLHYGGEDLYDIFQNIPEAERQAVAAVDGNAAQDEFVRGSAALTNYFTPRQNTEYQRYEFRKMKQQASENLDRFVTRLKTQAAT